MTGAFLLAAAFNVGSLPPIEHLDCEVSTNVVLATLPKINSEGAPQANGAAGGGSGI